MIQVNWSKPIVSEDVEERGPLSDRILFWLLKHPYQQVSDVAFALQKHATTICRSLLALAKQGLVERVTSRATAPHQLEIVYYLTTQGIERVASLVGGADPAQLARLWQSNEAALLRLLPRLSSMLPLQQVVQGLIADAPRQLAYPDGHPAAIRWHWQRAYTHTLVRHQQPITCRADAAVVFRRRPRTLEDGVESWHCVLVLIDPGLRGSTDLRLIRERFEQLLQWREHSERWSFSHAFPAVLILTPTAHQRDLWLVSAQEAAAHLRVAPLHGAGAVLATGSPWRFSWHLLDGSGTGTLPSLLEPLVPQAIPPGLLAPKQVNGGRTPRKNADAVVTGHFEQRSNSVEMSETGLKSRAACALLSLRLGYRHLDVLKEIYALPVVAAHELAALLRMEKGTLRRYLYDIEQMQCLTFLPTARGKRLTLSETGLRLMAMLLDVPLVHVAERGTISAQPWQQRGVSSLLGTIAQTAGIYGFLAQLQRQAWNQGQELLWWETTRSLRRYHHQGAWRHLMPDALFAYQAGEARVEAWLEWDTGSMHLGPLATKFEAYAHYVRSHQYRTEHQVPPQLLLVAPQNGREQSVRRVAASVLGTLPITMWTTTDQLLRVSGPLAQIWKRGGTGHDDGEEQGRSTWIERR